LNSWITELKQNSHPELKIFLIGNKNDLSVERQVTHEEAINFLHKNNLDYFEETSAKEGFNIEEIFKKAINILYSGFLKYLETNPTSNSNVTSIYATVNSKHSVQLKPDINKIKDGKEADLLEENKHKNFCGC